MRHPADAFTARVVDPYRAVPALLGCAKLHQNSFASANFESRWVDRILFVVVHVDCEAVNDYWGNDHRHCQCGDHRCLQMLLLRVPGTASCKPENISTCSLGIRAYIHARKQSEYRQEAERQLELACPDCPAMRLPRALPLHIWRLLQAHSDRQRPHSGRVIKVMLNVVLTRGMRVSIRTQRRAAVVQDGQLLTRLDAGQGDAGQTPLIQLTRARPLDDTSGQTTAFFCSYCSQDSSRRGPVRMGRPDRQSHSHC